MCLMYWYFVASIRGLRIVKAGLADDGGTVDNLSPLDVLYITASTNNILDNPLGAPMSDA